jgi:hypothetical protein
MYIHTHILISLSFCEPLAYTIDGLVTPAECAHIIGVAAPRMGAAHVSGAKAGYVSTGRTNALCWLPHRHDETVAAVVAKIARVVRLPPEYAESLQVGGWRDARASEELQLRVAQQGIPGRRGSRGSRGDDWHHTISSVSRSVVTPPASRNARR